VGEDPNHTTARTPGPLEIIQYYYSLLARFSAVCTKVTVVYRARIFKLLMIPGIYDKESILPAYLAWYSYSVPSPVDCLKIPAQYTPESSHCQLPHCWSIIQELVVGRSGLLVSSPFLS
jgi:hypothetical protein